MSRFNLGEVVMTRTIADELDEKDIIGIVKRHSECDWGDLCEEDKRMNDVAIETGEDRILSKYTINNKNVYIVIEWDRSVTTVLFADEY